MNASPAFLPSSPQPEKPLTRWELEIRQTMRRRRRKEVEAKTWPGARFTALPQPCTYVTEAHSINQAAVYHYLDDVAKGKHNRPATGARPRIEGKDGIATISDSALAHACRISIIAAHRAVRGLLAKHSIELITLRKVGERGPGNREPKRYRILPWAQVLEARRNDAAIATTHGGPDRKKSLQWTNGRPNSRRLLRPDEAEMWGLASLPAKPLSRFDAPPEVAKPPERAAAPKPEQVPAKAPAQRRMLVQVPADQQEILDQLCGFVEGADGPRYCDLSGEILASAQATAAITGRAFPAEKVGDFCWKWVFDNHKKLKGSGDRRYWIWKVEMPAAFMRSQARKQEVVLGYLDWADRQKQKVDRETYEKICYCLQLLRQRPQDAQLLEWQEGLQREFPDLYSKAYAEDDRKHGGDGSGSSWAPAKSQAMTSSGSSP